MRNSKQLRVLSAASAALAFLLLPLAPASAAESSAPEAVEYTISAPMDIQGYDRDVAEANGYKIEVDAEGNEYSVPVTAEAKAERREAERIKDELTGGFQTFGTDYAYGTCGNSFISATKYGGDYLGIRTGYNVYGPVQSRNWGVWANGWVDSESWSFNGGATARSWAAEAGGTVVGGGIAHVTVGSHAIMSDGSVCYSGNPSTDFP